LFKKYAVKDLFFCFDITEKATNENMVLQKKKNLIFQDLFLI